MIVFTATTKNAAGQTIKLDVSRAPDRSVEISVQILLPEEQPATVVQLPSELGEELCRYLGRPLVEPARESEWKRMMELLQQFPRPISTPPGPPIDLGGSYMYAAPVEEPGVPPIVWGRTSASDSSQGEEG
jgi:hypothetical protein